LARKNKKFFNRGSGYKGSRKEDQKASSTARSLDTSFLIVLTCRKRNLKKNPRNQLSNPTSSEDRSSSV